MFVIQSVHSVCHDTSELKSEIFTCLSLDPWSRSPIPLADQSAIFFSFSCLCHQQCPSKSLAVQGLKVDTCVLTSLKAERRTHSRCSFSINLLIIGWRFFRPTFNRNNIPNDWPFRKKYPCPCPYDSAQYLGDSTTLWLPTSRSSFPIYLLILGSKCFSFSYDSTNIQPNHKLFKT